MNPIMLDENGHIVIDDSMSDELKEKINAYNALAASDLDEVEEDISDEEADSYTEDALEDGELDEETEEEAEVLTLEPKEVNEAELNNLNDLFS